LLLLFNIKEKHPDPEFKCLEGLKRNTMPVQLLVQIEKLKEEILTASAMAEQSLREAVLAINHRDSTLARRVIHKDINLDQITEEVEDHCLKILAQLRPVAVALRFVMAVLRTNSDLEHIGNQVVNIAERALFLTNTPKVSISFDFAKMAVRTQEMLKKSINALVNLNAEIARTVCACRDIELMNKQMYLLVQDEIKNKPRQAESLACMLAASGHLERISDSAKNIARDAIYMIEEDSVKHKAEELDPRLCH